jgi:hypothetical protein
MLIKIRGKRELNINLPLSMPSVCDLDISVIASHLGLESLKHLLGR